jgi:hypothetical protein
MSLPAGVMDELEFQLIHDTSRQRHWCILPDAVNTVVLLIMGENRLKYVQLTWNNKLTYIVAFRWLCS